LAEKNSPMALAYEYDNLEIIKLITPIKTGPFCVREMVLQSHPEEIKIKTFQMCGSHIKDIKDYTTSEANDGDWVNKL
jgi:hypothetical protein